jgi:hypothetical protein
VPGTCKLLYQLDWSNTQGATHYDVYFGTNVLQPPQKIAGNITASHCSLPSLTIETIYYWKVIAGPYPKRSGEHEEVVSKP